MTTRLKVAAKMATRNSTKPTTNAPKAAKKRGATARRPGRPASTANTVDQRNRLVDIALMLFARQGIAETTLAAIAREAGVTPAMVHYYFKTRDQLLDVLIEERFLPVRMSIESVFQEHANDPVTAITQLVYRFRDITVEYPWFAPLWLREIISENPLLKQRVQKRMGNAHQESLFQCIARWQAEGRLNANIQPSLMFLSLAGLTILPLAAAKTWRDDPVRSQLSTHDITQHAVTLLMHGAGPQPPAKKKR
ncbi:MAG: TetR/AcrR family transcriptional regulator [Rhodanobacter sp.]